MAEDQNLETKTSEIAEGKLGKADPSAVSIVEEARKERELLQIKIDELRNEKSNYEKFLAEQALAGRARGGIARVKTQEDLDNEAAARLVKQLVREK